MSKTQNITRKIEELQTENEHLKMLDKLFEKAIKYEYGVSKKFIHNLLKNSCTTQNNFIKKITYYFDLKSQNDFDEFLSIICSESILKYYLSKRNSNEK